ncbi:MAG: Uma2 family endonuclease [Caldilineaceae bacterium]
MAAIAERISPQEYLELERKSATKHEYINGWMVEIAGASRKHNLIVGNIIYVVMSQLRGRSGEAYPSDMRICVPATGLYTYPDVTVVADKAELEDAANDILLNPTIIFEVLSSATEGYDRGEKFQNYRTVESLQEYVVVAQDTYHVEHFVRQPNGQWLFSETSSLNETIHLPSVGCDLPLAEIYNKVEISTGSDNHRMNGRVE